MQNGFSNVSIYLLKQSKTYLLNETDQIKYALEMSIEEMNEKNKRFAGATYKYTGQQKKIAGYQCESVLVTYQNGDKVNLYYSQDLTPQHEHFNAMFPGLKGIALEYQVIASPTVTMRFVANKVDVNVIDSKIFVLPPDYKIVTKTELEQLK
jgi:hypothetical protein